MEISMKIKGHDVVFRIGYITVNGDNYYWEDRPRGLKTFVDDLTNTLKQSFPKTQMGKELLK